jgi:hypothetical protein
MSKFDKLRVAYGKVCQDIEGTRQMCRDVLTELRREINDGWEIPPGKMKGLREGELNAAGLRWFGPFFENPKDGTHGTAFKLRLSVPSNEDPVPNVPAMNLSSQDTDCLVRVDAARRADSVVLTSAYVSGEVVISTSEDKDGIKDFANKLFEGVLKFVSTEIPTGAD